MNVMDDEMIAPGTAGNAGPGAALCVLASGSMGNCSVLRYSHAGSWRACLIDLGLSPRRTVRLLAGLGLGLHQIDDVLLTHLDHDHYHGGWRRALPSHARLRLHRQHLEFAGYAPLRFDKVEEFEDEPVRLLCGAVMQPILMSHDALGAAAFRIDMPFSLGAGSLGFATDLGHVTGLLIDHFGPGRGNGGADSGVDVLAIESNYCPILQDESERPDFLKHRITGGRGHLSNHEAAAAIRRIQPREHVVLLHLSRECNEPAIVAALHEGADYALTITCQFEPTRWVQVRGARRGRHDGRARAVAQTGWLFESVAGA